MSDAHCPIWRTPETYVKKPITQPNDISNINSLIRGDEHMKSLPEPLICKFKYLY